MTERTPPGTPGAHGPAGRPDQPAADGWQPQVVALVTVALTALMASLPVALPVPVLPQIAQDIHSSTTSTEWLLTSTLLGAAISVPIAGRLGDLYGKKLMLVAATFFLTVGSLICALSHTLSRWSSAAAYPGWRCRSPGSSASTPIITCCSGSAPWAAPCRWRATDSCSPNQHSAVRAGSISPARSCSLSWPWSACCR
jgi:MFS family permease